MKKNTLFGKIWKGFPSLIFKSFIILLLAKSLVVVDATILNNADNTLSWTNSNYTNSSNSGAYWVNYTLSGTFDTWDILHITATDNSGNTVVGSFLSTTGWQSSGTILLNMSNTLIDWPISYTWIVYSWGIATQVVASWMTLTGVLDTQKPVVSLVWPASVTVIQWWTYHESWALWTDTRDGSGTITLASSWSVNTSLTGTYLLEYFKIDVAGNRSSSVTRTVTVTAALDTVSPIVSVTSHLNNEKVTGIPTLSGLVSDTGWILQVTVNWVLANLWVGNWSKGLTNLVGWSNILIVVATDNSGNTWSTTINLNRVSIASNINSTLSGTTGVAITFSTDLTATGVVRYGTVSGSLATSITGSSIGTTHSFSISGLLPDTMYYYTVQGQWWFDSAVQQFKTARTIDNSVSGSLVYTGPVYLSGSTATGVTFLWSGSLRLLSITSSGSSLLFPLNSLQIIAVWSAWDGIIQPPELTSSSVDMLVSGYAFIGNAYQIGNAHTELIFSGQLATVSVKIGSALSGQTLKIFRSTNHGVSYQDFSTCVVNGSSDCIFTTDRLSLFTFAMPADTIPDAFSFSSLSNTELSTLYVSNSIIVSGITGQALITISGWEYSLNWASFTTASGVAHQWDSLLLRTTSSSSYSTKIDTTLTIGWVASIFSTTTKAASTNGGGVISGNWGPGGGWLSADVCLGGDLSPTYYDGLCNATTGNIITGIVTESFDVPAIFINSSTDIKFRDINGNWAKNYIIRLVVRGIIDNTTYYRPNASLTRAEFLKIIINTTGWDLPQTIWDLPFRDVSIGAWYAKYVSLALSKGLIRDYTYFNPNDSITRAEATKIFMEALGITVAEPSTMTFVDVNRYSDLAKYIEAAKFLNIISGQVRNGNNIFRPNDTMTRAEIAKVVANAFGL